MPPVLLKSIVRLMGKKSDWGTKIALNTLGRTGVLLPLGDLLILYQNKSPIYTLKPRNTCGTRVLGRRWVHRNTVMGSIGGENKILTLCILFCSRGILSRILLEVFQPARILVETLFTAVVGSSILWSVNRSLCTVEMVVNWRNFGSNSATALTKPS